MASWLANKRKSNNVESTKAHYASDMPAYTLLELGTGGGMDTISGANAGFRHLGGTEAVKTKLGSAKATIFKALTGKECLHTCRRHPRLEEMDQQP